MFLFPPYSSCNLPLCCSGLLLLQPIWGIFLMFSTIMVKELKAAPRHISLLTFVLTRVRWFTSGGVFRMHCLVFWEYLDTQDLSVALSPCLGWHQLPARDFSCGFCCPFPPALSALSLTLPFPRAQPKSRICWRWGMMCGVLESSGKAEPGGNSASLAHFCGLIHWSQYSSLPRGPEERELLQRGCLGLNLYSSSIKAPD